MASQSNTRHLYRTTRAVTDTMRFVDALTGKESGTPISIERTPSCCVFRGGKRAFQAHLAYLNELHGDGYAVPEVA